MKLSGFITIILAIGLCFAILGSVVNDFETEYPDIDVNTSWASEYDYQEDIAEDGTVLQRMLEKMGNEETGWVLKALIGIAAIPVAFISVIAIVFSTMGLGITLLTGVGAEVGIPQFVVRFGVTALTIIIIWAIMSWWRRYRD